jgi:two-component system, OmpR family, sensor histidine kinase CreC
VTTETEVLRLVVVAASSMGLILLVAFIASRLVRSRRRGLSIRMQVFIALASIVGAFAFGLGLMVMDRIEARAHRFATEAATDKAAVIAKLIGAEMEQYGIGLMELSRRLPDRASPNELEGVEVFGPQDQLLFRSSRGFPSERARTVSVSSAIFSHGTVSGRVRVVKQTIVMEALLRDFAPTVLVISLVLGAVAALAAAWIGRAIAGPLEALTEFSDEVSGGAGQATPPPEASGREVTRLTRSIDSMRRQLEGRPFVEAFAADLSHELKNPVAAIRASAELLLDGALAEPEQARRFVVRVHESVERIERLLSELLSLARIEARGVEHFSPLDLGMLVRDVCDNVGEQGRLDLRIQSKVHVRGERTWLARALSNLVENALHHSADASPVIVELRRDEGLVFVSVSNSGAIAKHARNRVFLRFFTTREDKGGSGLGLPIARAVAEAHRGRLELADPGPPLVCFRFTLPAA